MADTSPGLVIASFDLAAIRKTRREPRSLVGRFEEPQGAGAMSPYSDLTAETASRALREAGIPHPADALAIDAREERWAVALPDGRIAWFPASPGGASRLATERRVLRLLAERCSFRVPEVVFASDDGFDIRRIVPGLCDPWGLCWRCSADTGLARGIGCSLGLILAEQHSRIADADVAGWLPRRVPWPETGAGVRERRAVGGGKPAAPGTAEFALTPDRGSIAGGRLLPPRSGSMFPS
jgi:hypothetical protein